MHAVHGNKHRRLWIEDKLLELTTIFAIDLCTYAVIHNHYHVVLLINKSSADDWVPLEIVERWHRLDLTGFFCLPPLFIYPTSLPLAGNRHRLPRFTNG
jgi:hypothetical protein